MAPQLNYDELVQDERVHRRIYTDAEVFEAEMERIFERTWVFVGHESEVAASGDYKTITIGTQPAIMTRDEDGGINVLMNRCMHRGSTICQEQRGNSSLVRARVGIYRGLVFASLNPEVQEIAEHLARAKYYIDLFMDLSPEGEIDARCGIHKYGYDGNWKFQMENGVDGYHPNFVHQSFFEIQGKQLGRKVMKLFTEESAYQTKDLGNGHSILDMAPQRKLRRPVNNILRGSTSQAS